MGMVSRIEAHAAPWWEAEAAPWWEGEAAPWWEGEAGTWQKGSVSLGRSREVLNWLVYAATNLENFILGREEFVGAYCSATVMITARRKQKRDASCRFRKLTPTDSSSENSSASGDDTSSDMEMCPIVPAHQCEPFVRWVMIIINSSGDSDDGDNRRSPYMFVGDLGYGFCRVIFSNQNLLQSELVLDNLASSSDGFTAVVCCFDADLLLISLDSILNCIRFWMIIVLSEFSALVRVLHTAADSHREHCSQQALLFFSFQLVIAGSVYCNVLLKLLSSIHYCSLCRTTSSVAVGGTMQQTMVGESQTHAAEEVLSNMVDASLNDKLVEQAIFPGKKDGEMKEDVLKVNQDAICVVGDKKLRRKKCVAIAQRQSSRIKRDGVPISAKAQQRMKMKDDIQVEDTGAPAQKRRSFNMDRLAPCQIEKIVHHKKCPDP
ncbi:hypothetical protein GUJ93_ZPchr0004g38704 [Zizania palustris]|uniref:Uncharacterized protein n=1 Tax=Zizania palustris TaxID=103762 RepID=A0A8J5VFR1_ZIZPA|nr:hypothetical protein GUJ93_ZPchr0004g38704 [Zizania palustris]